MKLSFLILPVLVFSANQSLANISSASMFKEMRALNPAVISQRPAGTFAAMIKKDLVDKEQVVPNGSSTSEIDITNLSLFYGGKGGKGITTELSAEIGTGTKDDNVNQSGAVQQVSTTSDLMLAQAAVGFLNNFGLSFLRVSNDITQTNTDTNSTLTSITGGIKFTAGLDFGLFYQSSSFTQEGTSLGLPVNNKFDMPRYGIGIGYSNKVFHIEVGYVKDVNQIKEELGGGSGAGENVATYNPAKIVGTIEFKFKKLTLGVTSSYYIDGYFDFTNLIFNTMVLSSNKESRLENIFNFSFGGDKGHSFSGSASMSTVESTESPPTLLSGTKYKTTTKILGAVLSYSYAF
ncbi:hypothetical protein [Halobacteriovorax sp. HLS]|uniref:hypothetical protein n=1 Tax=Halobacteriovorax sp. HLS TaxID=2234000 RepID=UPI000FDA2DD6|nr:hypothetical protein [Halobacteriovorax sp. HLS]